MAKYYVVHGSVKTKEGMQGPGSCVDVPESMAAKLNLGTTLTRPALATEAQWKALASKKAADEVLTAKPEKAPLEPVKPTPHHDAKGGAK